MQLYEKCLLIALVIMVGIIPGTISAQSNSKSFLFPELQSPPILLKASKVLPANLLHGSNFRIEESVMNDGFVNTYKLSTNYGSVTVESTALLMMRIKELRALEHMEKLKKTKVFTEALKKGAKAPINTVKGLVTEPVDTVENVATGIGRWFSDVGRSITSDDPYQENVLKTAIGYSAVKRQFAYGYGIDPYTSYLPVQNKITEIATTGVSGGLTPKLAFGAVKKTAGKVLKLTSTADGMKQLIRDKSPAELEDINEQKLKSMGVNSGLIKHFLKNPYFNPQEKTLLVGALYSMSGVRDRRNFIAAAVQANEESVARFMRLRAEMMANYNAEIYPVSSVINVNGTPLLKRRDGAVIGLFPLDYIAWTPALYQKERAADGSIKKMLNIMGKELWIEGTFDPVARKALESRSWTLKENAGLILHK